MSSAAFASLTSETLLARFRDHLDAEERVLNSLVVVLSEVRSLLIRNHANELTRLSERNGELLNESRQLAAARTEFLQELAGRFDLDRETMSLARLADATGAAGEWLRDTRHRLRQLTTQVGRLNRENAAIIVHAADLAREMVRALTNTEPGDSYDADGVREDGTGGSMFHLDG